MITYLRRFLCKCFKKACLSKSSTKPDSSPFCNFCISAVFLSSERLSPDKMDLSFAIAKLLSTPITLRILAKLEEGFNCLSPFQKNIFFTSKSCETLCTTFWFTLLKGNYLYNSDTPILYKLIVVKNNLSAHLP